MSLRYIRTHYGVPAKKGGRVEYEGKPGTITGASGPHVAVRLDGERFARPYHPDDLRYMSETQTGEPAP